MMGHPLPPQWAKPTAAGTMIPMDPRKLGWEDVCRAHLVQREGLDDRRQQTVQSALTEELLSGLAKAFIAGEPWNTSAASAFTFVAIASGLRPT
jgi:hypothetical protein